MKEREPNGAGLCLTHLAIKFSFRKNSGSIRDISSTESERKRDENDLTPF